MTIYDWFKPQIDWFKANRPEAEDFTLYYIDYAKKKPEVRKTTFMELAESKLKFRVMSANLPSTR